MMSRELRLRTISGFVMAVAVLAASWQGGAVFRAFSAGITLLIYYEWSTIARLHRRYAIGNIMGWVAVVAICACIVFNQNFTASALLVAVFAAFVLEMALKPQTGGWLASGVFYAGLSGLSLEYIRGEDATGLIAMLFVFATVWATDILAYFVGRALRGPKLAPSISPGKTWSGAIGGTVSGVLAGLAVIYVLTGTASLRLAVIALAMSVAGQIGDLFESFIKRRFGVKDSSHLIPGHGGVMDRVDGLVFACFTAFILIMLHTAFGSAVMSPGQFLITP